MTPLRGEPRSGPGLTAKQHEVAVLYGQGFSAKEIAAKLGRSQTTIQFHLESARRRNGCANSTQLAVEVALGKIGAQ